MKKRLVWIGVVIVLGLFAAGAWIFIQPGFAVAELQDYVLRKTGRTTDERFNSFDVVGSSRSMTSRPASE